jgi:hypothetical protein
METGISAVAGTTNLNEQQVNYNSTVAAQAKVVDENAKAREVRPAEEAGDSAKAKAGTQSDTTTKTTIENKTDIVFTRYDSEGKEVNRVPPEYNAEG